MTTLTIEIPEKVEKTLTEFVEQLGGKIIDEKKSKSAKKKQVLEDLEESIRWVKLHQEGKVEGISIEQLLDEL